MKQKETIKTDSEIVHDIRDLVKIPDFSKFVDRTSEVVKLAWEIVSKEYPLITLEGPNVVFRDQSVDFMLWAEWKVGAALSTSSSQFNFSRAKHPAKQKLVENLLRKACKRIKRNMEEPRWMFWFRCLWYKIWRG